MVRSLSSFPPECSTSLVVCTLRDCGHSWSRGFLFLCPRRGQHSLRSEPMREFFTIWRTLVLCVCVCVCVCVNELISALQKPIHLALVLCRKNANMLGIGFAFNMIGLARPKQGEW
jgi:hypothetical protein